MRWLGATRGRSAVALVALTTLLGLAQLAAPADARTYTPKKGQVYLGVSDTGKIAGYREFTAQAGRRVPIMQAFETWGQWPLSAFERFEQSRTRAMLSISTASCYRCRGVITPRQIRRGVGDRYLLRLNQGLSNWDRPVYIRLLPEMNGHWNDYSAYNADGTRRRPGRHQSQFRRAWQRTVLIVRGGARTRIDRRLRRRGMGPIRPAALRDAHGEPPARLPRPKVSFMWVPQTHGSPNIPGNMPGRYWPGPRFVDWVGADIYAKFPNFAGLDRFFRSYRGKPFVIGEWAPWDVDNPWFVNRLHDWVERRGRARMMVYYQGFGEGNPFELRRYPAAQRAHARRIRNQRRYPAFAPGTPRPGG